MADDQTQTPPSNGATPPPADEPRLTLRDIAEQSWDEVQDAADDDSGEPTGQGERTRDSLGRFAPADQVARPGEQSTDPAPKTNQAPGEATPADPALGSNQPPQHWPEQDRQNFAKLPPEGQQFLLRRHTEMERDYQGKAQAAATAVQFTQSLAPIFQDPAIAGSLQQAGVSPYDAIGQWASFHRRAIDPNPQVRVQLWQELGRRMGLDPAATGQMSRPGTPGNLSEEDLKDPAIRYFADHLGKTFSEVQALRGELDRMHHQAAEAAQTEVLKVTRRGIDGFADEKDSAGQLRHPHFDAVLPHMIELYRANPERDLQEAYDMAIWAVPEIRASLIAAEQQKVQRAAGNQRAAQAVRSNVRGITSPVAKPNSETKATGLRGTLERSADEVGF